MSHNINTYNTNAFDVDSNQTVTVGTTQEYLCMRSSLSDTFVLPVTGLDVRIGNGSMVNNLSGVTINYDSTHTSHAASYTLNTDGTYLINAQASFFYNSTGSTDSQSFAIFEGSTQISNTCTHTETNIDYPYSTLMSSIVVVSGTAKTVRLRCLSAVNLSPTFFGLAAGWAARLNHFTIWRLK